MEPLYGQTWENDETKELARVRHVQWCEDVEEEMVLYDFRGKPTAASVTCFMDEFSYVEG